MLCKGELPVQRDQGLGTSIRQRTDWPLEPPQAMRGLEGGLDFLYHSRLLAHELANNSASNAYAKRRQALDGSVGLSFIR
jgi:hypothetical protein